MFIDRWYQRDFGSSRGAKYIACVTHREEHFAPLELALYLRPTVYKHFVPTGLDCVLTSLTRKNKLIENPNDKRRVSKALFLVSTDFLRTLGTGH